MKKLWLLSFLGIANLFPAVNRQVVFEQQAIPYTFLHTSTDTTLDEKISFKNRAEEYAVKKSLKKRVPNPSLSQINSSFVLSFLSITNLWIEECARSNSSKITRTLGFFDHRSQLISTAIFSLERKNKQIAVNASLTGPQRNPPVFLKNLILSVFYYPKPTLLKTNKPALLGLVGIVTGAYVFTRKTNPQPPPPKQESFFHLCEQRLHELAKLLPDNTLSDIKLNEAEQTLFFFNHHRRR